MLTLPQLQRAVRASGSRSLTNTETDVLLTHLLELAVERGLAAHLAFKGGTMLRKTVFGDAGRISTDLDFTCANAMSKDDLSLLLAGAFQAPYRGMEFSYQDKDWYETDDGCGFTPRCSHAANPRGVAIKVQASLREWPVLAPVARPQSVLPHFGDLGFQPSAIPCLRLEEVVAEKVRAASERSKGRDLYDLAEMARNPACSAMDKPLVRSVAALKLWSSGRVPLSYENLVRRLSDADEQEVADLQSLLRRDAKVDPPGWRGWPPTASGSSPTWTRWKRRSSWRLDGRTPTTRPPRRWRRTCAPASPCSRPSRPGGARYADPDRPRPARYTACACKRMRSHQGVRIR